MLSVPCYRGWLMPRQAVGNPRYRCRCPAVRVFQLQTRGHVRWRSSKGFKLNFKLTTASTKPAVLAKLQLNPDKLPPVGVDPHEQVQHRFLVSQ